MKFQNLHFTCLIILLTIISFGTSKAQIFVDSSAVDGGTGISWAESFNDLQDAISTAQENDTIYVAEGTYYPNSNNGDQTSTFLIDEDLVILGGFDASTGLQNPVIYETILSGDLDENDIEGNFEDNKADNIWTIITIDSNITNETYFEGITVRNGYANGNQNVEQQINGGAVFSTGSPKFKDCIFKQNFASESGGALCQEANSDNIEIKNCSFESNRSRFGGGICINNAHYEVYSSTFQFKSAQKGLGDAEGGGIYCFNGNGTIQNCEFFQNNCEYYGGGISLQTSADALEATVEIRGCVFQQNICYEYDGGGLSLWAGGQQPSFSVIDCEFIENEAEASGGLELGEYVHSLNSDLLVDSCSFIDNLATVWGYGGISISLAGTNTHCSVRNSLLKHNSAPTFFGGGAGMVGFTNGSGLIEVINCTFEENDALDSGGLDIGSLPDANDFEYHVSDCTFLRNMATASSGGLSLYAENTSEFTVERCYFKENTSNNLGAGIHVNTNRPDANILVQNCIMENNNSPHGAAITTQPYLLWNSGNTQEADITFSNCLIKENNSSNSTIRIGGLGNIKLLNCTVVNNENNSIELTNEGALTLQNTILYNPGNIEFSDLTNDNISISSGGNLVYDSSMDSFLASSDQSNISPDFDSLYLPIDGGNLVNSGINDGVNSQYDLAMNPRIQNGIVDIGAFESSFVTHTEEVNLEEVQLSPNPVTDYLQIHLNESMLIPFEANLLDSQGRLILHKLY